MRDWRDRMRIVVLVVFAANVLSYGVKLLVPWRLVSAHVDAVVPLDWAGIAVSLIAFFLAPICLKGWRMISVLIGSLVLGYLWFSSIAFWVMMK
jgi:hypothetical protein